MCQGYSGARKETTLLTEDTNAVGRGVAEVLCKNGYRALAGADGLETLTVSDLYVGSIDILITDVTIPLEWSGSDPRFQTARSRYTSCGHPGLGGRSPRPRRNFSSKPFTLAALSREFGEIVAGQLRRLSQSGRRTCLDFRMKCVPMPVTRKRLILSADVIDVESAATILLIYHFPDDYSQRGRALPTRCSTIAAASKWADAVDALEYEQFNVILTNTVLAQEDTNA